MINLESLSLEKKLKQEMNTPKTCCGKWASLSECESGQHHFAKIHYCNKEWCPICGRHNSPAHKRRIARILPKAMQIKSMGYFVIEFPDIYRHIGPGGLYRDEMNGQSWCYSKKDLQDTTNLVVEVLAGKRTAGSRGSKRINGYFKRGLLRWHWFGDKIPGKYNPHINVLFDSKYIPDSKLGEIKQALRQKMNCPDLIINYSYCDNPGEMYHKVEYITRSTFLNYSWNPYLATELFNFRNQRWWGKWHGEKLWSVETSRANKDIEIINRFINNLCPDCNDKLRTIKRNFITGMPRYWSRPIDSIYLIIWSAEPLGDTGYYRIKNSEWYHGTLNAGKYLTDDL